MPLGWERINVKKAVPNKNIAFIKPRPGRDENTSRDFLERIAAQCVPIMNNNHLSVVSLEEYEPNVEFWGRNFNNGEVIQLVLKSPSTGHWLPFKFVQAVMMHELAHCKQMNHSSAFHKVRIGFTKEMKELWEKGYTGDGLWGRGVLLENGAFARTELGEGEFLPENLCGGIFKSRGSRKRKIKPRITYKQRQERRIRKKFGTNGVALGADEDVKAKLERGKKPAGKPRVAGSARGRELRAAAALARFETAKEEPHKDEDLVTDSEVESGTETIDAVDIDGSTLLGRDGFPLVKVSEDEDRNDENAKNELLELQGFNATSQQPKLSIGHPNDQPVASKSAYANQPKKTMRQAQSLPASNGQYSDIIHKEDASTASVDNCDGGRREKVAKDKIEKQDGQCIVNSGCSLAEGSCPVCSMDNELTSLTCLACSNVLKPDFMPNSWQCNSALCQGSEYINAGDVGLCGVCNTKKGPKSSLS